MRFIKLFYQPSDEGIPSHWCVQYIKPEAEFVSYAYFGTEDEALQWVRLKFGDNYSVVW